MSAADGAATALELEDVFFALACEDFGLLEGSCELVSTIEQQLARPWRAYKYVCNLLATGSIVLDGWSECLGR